jgi:Nucleotidyl transferase AbiEii toxin, Type IV TA system
MNLAQQLQELETRGFAKSTAQVLVLVRESAILLFQAFPHSFLLYGGANLILFHNSLRTSRDLDLLSRGAPFPDAVELTKVLSDGLQDLGNLLGLSPLTVRVILAQPGLVKLEVMDHENRNLFTVDLGGLGSVLKSGIEEHSLEAVSTGAQAIIRTVSRDHLLLQKAEAFLFRSAVKARDAYDIRLLLDAGATLSQHLKLNLTDALTMREIAPEQIAERIAQVRGALCRSQLAEVLPAETYKALERADFQDLRAALEKLFEHWL